MRTAPETCEQIDAVVATARDLRSEALGQIFGAWATAVRNAYQWLSSAHQGLNAKHS